MKPLFRSGSFLAATVFLLEPDTGLLTFAAGCGDDVARLRSITISSLANAPEGEGVAGRAFRDQTACVSNDYRQRSPLGGLAQRCGGERRRCSCGDAAGLWWTQRRRFRGDPA